MLTLNIASFSYKKTGYPNDTSGHGGGFVFDCRGLPNPGRLTEYKHLSGLDQPVKDYLENQTQVVIFRELVITLLDTTLKEYQGRSFDYLAVSFGCTGGQHRSVYMADYINEYYAQRDGIQCQVTHCNQGNWVKKQ